MKKNRSLQLGGLLFILGIILSVFGRVEAASRFGEFISGLAIGLSAGAMIAGIILVVYGIVKTGRTK